MRLRRLIAGIAGLCTFASLVAGGAALAADPLDGFDAGWLIDNDQMYGAAIANSMSERDIQDFLNTWGGRCVKGSDGSLCLKDITFPTEDLPVTKWCPHAFTGGANDSVATIIAKAARACEISPRVLLVLLQKEQGLVQTTNPTKTMYAHALGFACPDSAPCSPEYAGLPTQVYAAASRLQEYRRRPAAFRFREGITADIAYHPNSACGTQRVTIRTAATAALYNYTPYVPNTAALANPWGSGDSCSSYGNRNFYRIHTTWFGRPNPQRTASSGPSSPSTPVVPGPLTKKAVSPLVDVTGDGRGDAVVAASGEAVMLDLRGARAGEVVSGRARVGQGWTASETIAAGDWDADGGADLILRRGDGTLALYSGNGAGWLSPRVIGWGWQGFDAIFGGFDWDGDGLVDLLARKSTTGELYLYPSNGRGGFGAPRVIGWGWQGFSRLAVVPSWSDGHPAVAGVVASTGQLRMYVGDGRGGFSSRVDLGHGWGVMSSIAGVPDMNGDGRGELVALPSSGVVRVYAASGESFTNAGSFVLGWTGASVLLPAGDMSRRTVFVVNADGALWRADVNAWPDKVAGAHTGVRLGRGDRVLNPGDWDGDGVGDVLVWRTDGGMWLHRGLGESRFDAAGRRIGWGWMFKDVVAVRSWLGDGRPGLLALTSSGELLLYPGNGTGGFGSRLSVGSGLTWSDMLVEGGNWSSTGGVQLIARRASDGALMWMGSDTRTVQVDAARQIGNGWGGMRSIVNGGDVTGDGRDDLFALRNDGTFLVYAGAGDHRFGTVTRIGTLQ